MRTLAIKTQQGNILVMFTIGLFALIAMAALALDSSHLLLNKNRLQNYVDAAALNAAKAIEDGGDHNAARIAAVNMLNLNLQHPDASEIAASFDLSAANTARDQITTKLLVQFFNHPEDTVASNLESAKFVKVQVSNINLSNFLAQILSFNKKVSARALAGASTPIQFCFKDLVPMMACGIKTGADPELFGFAQNELQILKMDSNPDSQIGPGNFQLIRLGDSHGANDIREAMAGGNDSSSNVCFTPGSDDPDVGTTSEVPTEPGNTVGPVAQGLNTRLNIYHGPLKGDANLYPRDKNACQGSRVELDNDGKPFIKIQGKNYYQDAIDDPDTEINESTYFSENIYSHDDYEDDNEQQSCGINDGDWDGSGTAGRRIIKIVVGNCTGEDNGANTVEFLGVGCFLLTQETSQKGNQSYVVGEFLSNCTGNGWPSGNTTSNGPHTLVLYHVPESTDS